MASRFLKYAVLLQKYRTGVLVASCGGVFAANMFYHVFPDLSYRQLYQAWYKGEPVTLSDKLEVLFQQVLKDYSVEPSKQFSAFASFGFHPVSAGVPWLPAGAQIGIPANFNSTAADHGGITNRTIFINAQKFAIAREVARLQSGAPVVSAAVAPLCLGGVWVYSVVLKQVFGVHAGPALLRGAANLAALGLGAVSYFLTSDAVTQWSDYSSDRRAAEVSRDYAKGGLEFYDKILSRNKTLRSLMGRKGEEIYAPSGNLFPANILQLKHTPYTSRREGILTLINKDKI
ncbi:transmembrane protein 177 isoform X2 [Syngnathoides biaculeatus]|uniref:transmembrane protein 177 isoform X2 n=1 Tax=Syngnathoides biaculeatus TaxID=300417 RepID=UPI002ADDFA49|nr:transmembrane protein 177 isoform X2 [Syngnathoides biaculeatus]